MHFFYILVLANQTKRLEPPIVACSELAEVFSVSPRAGSPTNCCPPTMISSLTEEAEAQPSFPARPLQLTTTPCPTVIFFALQSKVKIRLPWLSFTVSPFCSSPSTSKVKLALSAPAPIHEQFNLADWLLFSRTSILSPEVGAKKRSQGRRGQGQGWPGFQVASLSGWPGLEVR